MRAPRRTSTWPLLALAATAFSVLALAPAADAEIRMGFALKKFAKFPAQRSTLNAALPSMDRTLVAVNWRSVQPSCGAIKRGRFDWEKTDRAMRALAKRRLEVIVNVQNAPGCATADRAPEPSARWRGEFGSFVARLTKRYGGRGPIGPYDPYAENVRPVRAIEVWSEQNLDHKWFGSRRAYQHTFMAVADAVRKRGRKVSLMTGGVGFCCDPDGYVRRILSSPKMRRAVDAVGVHSYAPSPRAALRKLKRVRKAIPRKAEIAVTESGWSTCPKPRKRRFSGKCVTREGQAKRMAGLVGGLRRNRFLEVSDFLWFQPQDYATPSSVRGCGKDPKSFYGIYTHPGEAKPSLAVWERLTRSDLRDRIRQNPRIRDCKPRDDKIVTRATR